MTYKHNDCESYNNFKLTLHDCRAEKITYNNGILSFYMSDGFGITPNHEASDFANTVRTDAARVDFKVDDILDVSADVFIRKRNIIKRTIVEYWDAEDLMEAVNSGRCVIEFIYQYKSFFEQMWRCAIHSTKKLHYAECYLHIPNTEAVYRWNELRPDCVW